MKKEKVMKQEKLIIEDKMKRYTFFSWYDKDNSYRLTQCVAKNIKDAEHIFADSINLPYIKTAGKKEWHLDIDEKWWDPLKINKYRDIWSADYVIRNNFITSYIKLSEDFDVPHKELCLFTFALGCIEGGPFLFQIEASSIDEAITIWIKRIPYQRYLSKGFRIKLKTDVSKKYSIEEMYGMENAYKIDWVGCDSSLFVIKDFLPERGVTVTI